MNEKLVISWPPKLHDTAKLFREQPEFLFFFVRVNLVNKVDSLEKDDAITSLILFQNCYILNKIDVVVVFMKWFYRELKVSKGVSEIS